MCFFCVLSQTHRLNQVFINALHFLLGTGFCVLEEAQFGKRKPDSSNLASGDATGPRVRPAALQSLWESLSRSGPETPQQSEWNSGVSQSSRSLHEGIGDAASWSVSIPSPHTWGSTEESGSSVHPWEKCEEGNACVYNHIWSISLCSAPQVCVLIFCALVKFRDGRTIGRAGAGGV